MNKLTGAVVASAVASLFAANVLAAGATAKDSAKTTTEKVKCVGVNACKGKGECSQDGHGCAQENACKGKGWVTRDSEKQCKDQGGTVLAVGSAEAKPTPTPKAK